MSKQGDSTETEGTTIKWRVEFKDWRGYWNTYDTYSSKERANEAYESQSEHGRRLIRVVEREMKQTDTAIALNDGSSPASDAAGVMPRLCIEMYSVEERMPEEGRLILAYCQINGYRTLRYGGEKGWLDVNGGPIEGHPLSYNYTHWGYLPEEDGAA